MKKRVVHDRVQRLFNDASVRTNASIGRFGKKRFADGPIDIGHADRLGRLGQTPAAGVAARRCQQSRMPKLAQNTAHDDRVGAVVLGNVLGAIGLVWHCRHMAQRMQGERELAVSFHVTKYVTK